MACLICFGLFSIVAFIAGQAGETGTSLTTKGRYSRFNGGKFRRLGDHAEEIVRDVVDLLVQHQAGRTDIKLWEHTTDIRERVLSSHLSYVNTLQLIICALIMVLLTWPDKVSSPAPEGDWHMDTLVSAW